MMAVILKERYNRGGCKKDRLVKSKRNDRISCDDRGGDGKRWGRGNEHFQLKVVSFGTRLFKISENNYSAAICSIYIEAVECVCMGGKF